MHKSFKILFGIIGSISSSIVVVLIEMTVWNRREGRGAIKSHPSNYFHISDENIEPAGRSQSEQSENGRNSRFIDESSNQTVTGQLHHKIQKKCWLFWHFLMQLKWFILESVLYWQISWKFTENRIVLQKLLVEFEVELLVKNLVFGSFSLKLVIVSYNL